MEQKIVWQQDSSSSENPNNLATIREWWANLSGKEVTWQQRITSQTTDVEELDWEAQRFDEVFAIGKPEIRGITLYWQKPDGTSERNTTPDKVILDRFHQCLYIFPQSQQGLVMRVGLPSVSYQMISITNPQYFFKSVGENYILTLRDGIQNLEVKVTLETGNLKQLLRTISR